MRIGGFWGMPAPMLLVAFPDISELKSLISAMQRTVNSDVMLNLQYEFYELSRIEDLTVVETHIDDANAIFVKRSNDCTVVNGHLMCNEQVDAQDAEFKNELVRIIADMIIKGEQKEKYVSLGSGNTVTILRGLIDDWFSDKSFDLLNTKKSVRALYKTLVSENGTPCTDRIVEDFVFDRVLPQNVIVNGESIELSGSLRTICEWYLARIDVIKDLTRFAVGDPIQEEKVIDVSFFDLIRRKPESFQYMVFAKFETIKNKPSAALIQNTVNTVKDGVAMYRKCMREYVQVYTDDEKFDVLNRSEYSKISSSFPVAKSAFFDRMIDDSQLRLDDYTVEGFEALSMIYDRVHCLNVDRLNSVFGLNLNRAQWGQLCKDACSVFICGLNLKSRELFKQSITTLSMLSAGKVKRSQTFVDSVEAVLSSVDSLITTIRPIGDAL